MKLSKKYASLLAILILAVILRFYQLETIPAGLNIDEVSEGYNAYSILETGADRYGKKFPVLFRTFSSFQPPIYTYLTVIPTYFWGPNAFSTRFVAAVSGVFVVVFTFLIIKNSIRKGGLKVALLTSLILATAPWAIFFSRFATEAVLGLVIFVSAIYLLIKSFSDFRLFPIACLVMGLSTHAYYSERVTVFLFLISFFLVFKRFLLKYKSILILGIFVFILTQIPHLMILKTGAFTRRLEQVTYLNYQSYLDHGERFKNLPFGRAVFVGREFLSHYLAYFSPRNLFFDPDPQEGRSIPDLSVFYSWMIVPFVIGLKHLIKNYSSKLIKILTLLVFVAPIPAAMGGDPFYTLRVLELLWVFTIVISLGFWAIVSNSKKKFLISGLCLGLLIYSLFVFWRSYFVLFKYERAHNYGQPDEGLVRITQELSQRRFVVDLSRDLAIGLRFAFFTKYDPARFQQEIGKEFLSNYYTGFGHERVYKINNVEVRAINWKEDSFKDQVLVGDTLAISEDQAEEHKLSFEFEIEDLVGNVAFRAYSTNPKEKCLFETIKNVNCKK